MTTTAREMIEALEVLWDNDPAAADRFEAIGLGSMSAATASALIAAAAKFTR